MGPASMAEAHSLVSAEPAPADRPEEASEEASGEASAMSGTDRNIAAAVDEKATAELRQALLQWVALRHVPAVAAELSEARARLKVLRAEEVAAATRTAEQAAARAAEHAECQEVACVVCLEGSRTHAFLPCGHRAVCKGCSERLASSATRTCPMCRDPFQS